jgi:hypothetical protein
MQDVWSRWDVSKGLSRPPGAPARGLEGGEVRAGGGGSTEKDVTAGSVECPGISTGKQMKGAGGQRGCVVLG